MHSGAAVGLCNNGRQSITLETNAKTLQILRRSASVGRQRGEQWKRFPSLAVGLIYVRVACIVETVWDTAPSDVSG